MAIYGSNVDVLQFRSRSKDWTQQELAEFYRVENALSQSGLRVLSERGLSDESDPWFIFLRENDHEPLVHFARIDGYYFIASAAYDGVAKGKNFREMILDLLSRHRLNSKVISNKSNVFWHPAALLITLVGVAFFKATTSSKADEAHDDDQPHEKNLPLSLSKTNIAPNYRPTSESRTQSQKQIDSGWSVEMTNALLSAIAFLPLMDTTAEAQTIILTNTRIQNESKINVNDFAALTSNTISHSQTSLLSQGSSSQELQASSAMLTSGVKQGMADVQFSDALNIVEMLNQIPSAKLASEATTLSTIIKTAATLKNISNINSEFSHSDEAGALAYARSNMNTEMSKYSFSVVYANEKPQKDSGSDLNKSITETTHTSKIQFSDLSPQTVPVELQEINSKISLTSVSGSALTVINQLNTLYHLTDYAEMSPVGKIDINTTLSSKTGPSSPNDAPENSSPILAMNYSVSTNVNSEKATDSITPPSSQSAVQLGNNTNQLSGDQVGNLLNKFMQSFTNAHFAPSSSNEFVFQTDASLNTQGPLEQIIISFNDGSHINIIGQKGEIDNFISLI